MVGALQACSALPVETVLMICLAELVLQTAFQRTMKDLGHIYTIKCKNIKTVYMEM